MSFSYLEHNRIIEIPYGPTKYVLARLMPGPTIRILQHLPLDQQLIFVGSTLDDRNAPLWQMIGKDHYGT